MKFLPILALLSIAFFHNISSLTASAAGKDNDLKRAKVIRISSIDTTGYKKVLTYPEEDLEEIFAEKMDSLVTLWYVQNAFVLDSLSLIQATDSITGNVVPDSIYIQRLQNLNSFIDLSYNKTVKSVIDLYTKRRRELVEVMLGLSQYYFPMFEEILDKYDMPLELKYLPIIESALNPKALSRVGACGLWQFMYGTGKYVGLEITSFVDERRDPYKSSIAAAKYLKQLYDIYGDWHLVIAAYNCGPGNVNKAMRRAGGSKDYWKIYYRLPKETRGYVPAFIAAAYVMNYYQQHGLKPKQPSFNIVSDTIQVKEYLNLNQVAAQMDISIEQLRDYNPQYRKDIIPATKTKPYILRLPHNEIGNFIDNQRAIFTHKREEYFPDNKIKVPNSKYAYVPVDIKGKDKIYYKVKSGDNLGFIANWFHVRLSDVRYWNNIHRNLIRVGQKLVIYVPKGKGEYYQKFDKMSFTAKQQSIGKTTVTASTQKAPVKIDPNYVYHTVRRNENLWTIAKKYPGISANDIMRLNSISNARTISVGQKLKIKSKS